MLTDRKIEVVVEPGYRNEGPTVQIWQLEQPNWEARLAVQLVERWGMVAALPDGEDSAGRSKARLATPKEITTHACDVAALLVSECRARGWVDRLPSPEEAKKIAASKKTALT